MQDEASMRCTLLCVALVGAASTLNAAETIIYSYDELGRLIATSTSGGPANGQQSASQFDPAGNRAQYAVGSPGVPIPNSAVFTISGTGAVDEGSPVTFTIHKSGMAGSTLTVNYATIAGTAGSPSDFVAASGTIAFRAWETQRTITISTIADGLAEPVEQFSVVLSAPSPGGTVGAPSSAVGTINASTGTMPNQAPVTVPDVVSTMICGFVSVNVIANDSDPDGDVPLTLIGVNPGVYGATSISGSGHINYSAYGGPGIEQIIYTIQDSRGAIATGILAVTVTGDPPCF